MGLFENINNGKLDTKVGKQTKEPFIVSEEDLTKLCETVKASLSLKTNEAAWVAIAASCQLGGVNDRKTGKKAVNITFEVNGIKVTNQKINGLIKNQYPKNTIRQFAKAVGIYIFKTCKDQDIPGFLVIDLERNYTDAWENISDEDKTYWATDFYTHTEECPTEIRNLLRSRYENRYKTRKRTLKEPYGSLNK